MAVQFGVVTGAATYGVCQNIEIESTIENETYLDADGDVAGVHSGDEQKKISCEYIYDGTAAPTVGNTMAIGGVTYVVTSVKQVEENKGFRKVQIEGINWETNSVPA